MNSTTDKQSCFCGSTRLFNDCCHLLLSNKTRANTAQQLMRSRYSAFCTANIDYLLATHHPRKSNSNDRELLIETIDSCQWLSLEITQTIKGDNTDLTGEVEFIARYLQDKQLQQLREHSYFVKENDSWLYLEGDIIIDDKPSFSSLKNQSPTDRPAKNKLGRNSPCWCGSMKKYKHCHFSQ